MQTSGVVILNFNSANTTIQLVNRLEKFSYFEKVVIVDNCSNDNSFDILRKIVSNKVDVIQTKENKGYSYGNNYGIKFLEKFKLDIIFIANPDVNFEEVVVKRIIDVFSDKRYRDYALLSSARVDSDKQFTQNQHWKIPTYTREIMDCFFLLRLLNKKKAIYSFNKNSCDIIDVEVVPGSFFAVRADVLKNIGYFDENVFLFYEENILAYKLKNKNYKEGILTKYHYIHDHDNSSTISLEASSKALEISMRSALYFQKKYNAINKLEIKILEIGMRYCLFERKILIKIKKRFN
ncbi:hypothetical protein SAMN05878443_1868 [Carnobacterium alterfunditum]|uniref:Glycosyltransferase 2-like domain-containing protein n=1 Tax=Carnobacterium alterfunditum TaxID=28230 RepID=A0A1N6HHQ9_9LACT|nr:glycosyltransferase family 2 protein [Carnobacterium alterfunditum]SIO19404.1 hypothetical protein SAMN05878443_1868 [Carnobacterium alterfunditum]